MVLTAKQLLLLRLVSMGLSLSEAARRLGVSRQDASATLRRAERRYREALETVLLYAAHRGPCVRGERGETVESLAERLIEEADRAGVKLVVGKREAAALLRGLLGGRASRGVLEDEACAAVEPSLGIPLVVPCPEPVEA